MSLKINQSKCSQCTLKCSHGSKFANISSESVFNVDETPIYNVLDLQKHILSGNINFGICAISGNPCIPTVLHISGGEQGVSINGSEIVTNSMQAQCAIGGTIELTELMT